MGGTLALACLQTGLYAGCIGAVITWVNKTRRRPLMADAALYSAVAAWTVRGAFWSVFLVRLADALISFLRVEEFLPDSVGAALTTKLGLWKFGGLYVHYPLIGLSCVIAFFTRLVSVVWLEFLVVLAELQIVISRLVFSYEQALMGDLVRFWYASLFLLASAYTLVEEGHVRVDVFYARFSERGKARANVVGAVVLGLPLCWVILWMGLDSKAASLASPMVAFEMSQSGFGMYVKYLMAACLVVFAAAMNAQFAAYFLRNVAVLRGECNSG
jgi:TRAP-type mannitol/chloroaromatic compound transport system permease small subunit